LFEKWLGSDNLAAFFSEYLMFIGIWIITFLFVVVPKSNRPMLKAWGYNRDGNNIKGIIAGALLGFGCNGFCVLMSVLMGDIKLSFYGFNPTILLAFLLVVMIQSGAEEITDRLYLYQKLRRRYKSPLFAIIVNPAIFMILHVFNDGFTALAGAQIVLVGIIFSVLVYYYNSLWAAIWFHTLWNFTQNIIFGLPNSGNVSDYSIFKLEAASAQSGLFYDVEFGVEGSIGSSLVLALVLVVIIFINRGKGEKRDYWADAASDAGYESKH
jgi:membrane protease YdiL (CAAX protease family)